MTFKDKDVRKVVALEKAKAQTEEEAIADPVKSKVYYKYMDASQVGMAGHLDEKVTILKVSRIIYLMFNIQLTSIPHWWCKIL